MKYDVFISCRSYDYAIAEEISNFLKEKGLKVFFSNRSIDQEGLSLYGKVIANAIRDSANMIVVCSNPNYVKFDEEHNGEQDEASRWVYYEWSTFHQMILDKEKPIGADIITIYTPTVNKKELPHRLRNRQCIPYAQYKERILRYVDDNAIVQETTDDISQALATEDTTEYEETKPPRWRNLWLIPLIAGIVGILLGLGLSDLGKLSLFRNNSEKTLILAGGGSVVTFLEEEKLPNKKNKTDTLKHPFSENKYPNAYYLHMPSKDALTLLAEEAMMPNSLDNQPFYPVCLSAEKADISMFTKNCDEEQIMQTGHIIQYHLGYEQLAVYVYKGVDALDTLIDPNVDVITLTQLRKLLKMDGFDIFCTSKQSGTYDSYKKCLDGKDFSMESLEGRLKNFTNQSSRERLQIGKKGKNDVGTFVLLGGKYYRPQQRFDEWLRAGTVRQLMLENDNHKPVMRPLFLYFMAYRKNRSEDFYIPKEVLSLLKYLEFSDDKHEIIDVNNRLIIKGNTDQLIIPIN